MSSEDGQGRGALVGARYGPRLKGPARAQVSEALAVRYEAGATIRALAVKHGWSYGRVRSLLLEAGVTLRRPGGRHPRKAQAGGR